MQTLLEIIERFQHRGIRVMFCGTRPALLEALKDSEILARVGTENFCANLKEVAQRIARPTAPDALPAGAS